MAESNILQLLWSVLAACGSCCSFAGLLQPCTAHLLDAGVNQHHAVSRVSMHCACIPDPPRSSDSPRCPSRALRRPAAFVDDRPHADSLWLRSSQGHCKSSDCVLVLHHHQRRCRHACGAAFPLRTAQPRCLAVAITLLCTSYSACYPRLFARRLLCRASYHVTSTHRV